MIRIWDQKTGQTVHNFPGAHKRDILCIDLSPDGNIVATAGLDMKIHLINTINGKFIADLACGESKKEEKRRPKNDEELDEQAGEEEEEEEDDDNNSIESVTFCKSLPLVACATLNGQIFVWDLNTHTLRASYVNEKATGYTKLVWSSGGGPGGGALYASTVDGCFQVFDGRNLKLLKRMRCHTLEIFDFCLDDTAAQNVLYTASNDNTVKLFSLDSSQ